MLNKYLIFLCSFILLCSFSAECRAEELKSNKSDFLKYINLENYDYKNVLVLGVGAKQDRGLKLIKKYDFDLVIPVSREGGSSVEDWGLSAIDKLGIPTGSIEQLKGKNIENMYIHSWGSSKSFNMISMYNTHVKNIHALGSPHSTVSSLNKSIDSGLIKKVYFHINEGDRVAGFRHLPSGLQGKFSDRIEFHFYSTKNPKAGTGHKQPFNIPIFNAPIGFNKYTHYNSPNKGHGLENYFANISSVLNKDKNRSPFKENIPPFYYGSSQQGRGPQPNGAAAPASTKNFANKTRCCKIVVESPVKEKTGGVYIDPEIRNAGILNSDLKEKILNSRPSEDDPYWSIDIPKEIEK